VDEHIKEFEQLQMRVGSQEESKLAITRFFKCLSPYIANKFDLLAM